jgi:DNA-binding MarR family transcriptional regulator
MSDESPDFAILLAATSRCLVDRMQAGHEAAGFPGVRSPHGFVLRSLRDGGLTLTELAGRLDVTKQAVLKVVDEMEERGLVERVPRTDDRRAKEIRLTRRGRAVSTTALKTSAAIEAELRADLGDAAVDHARAVLLRFIERHGGFEDALHRRARPVW